MDPKREAWNKNSWFHEQLCKNFLNRFKKHLLNIIWERKKKEKSSFYVTIIIIILIIIIIFFWKLLFANLERKISSIDECTLKNNRIK